MEDKDMPRFDWEYDYDENTGTAPQIQKQKMTLQLFLKKYTPAIIGLSCIAVISYFGIVMAIADAKAQKQKEQEAKERNLAIMSYIGEKVIIASDTMVIINVDLDKQTYILNNNQEISIAFITNKQKR